MAKIENTLTTEEVEIAFSKVKTAPEDLHIPVRATLASAGYDFFLPKEVVLKAHSCSELIPSGIKVYMPENYYLGITIRSSLAMKGIRIPQGEAIIDSDYVDNSTNEGEIGLVFYNDSDSDITLEKGMRCAQGIFKKYYITDDDAKIKFFFFMYPEKKEEYLRKAQRKGGFGSTGI